MRTRPAVLALALAALLPPVGAVADVIPVGGKVLRGTWWEDGDDLVVNPYNSTNHAMTWGVERFPKARAKLDKIKPTETPEEEYCRRAFAIRAGTAADHADLAKWCAGKKLEALEAREWERTIEVEPENEEARKALGPGAVKEILRRNGRANRALGELLQQYAAAQNVATRRVLFERMKREHDVAIPIFALERANRSAKRPRGRTDDVPLTFRSDKVKGREPSRYTMQVPESYDPLRPTPLLLGLHGGGPGGKKGDKVVGSGPSAMNFYMGISESRGWLVVCPTALEAGWNNEPNDLLLDAVLQEVQLLYNVDLNRVYLTGHSMGGGGSWYWAGEWAGRWAAVSPMAGWGGSGSVGKLKDTQTFCYVFHGADDNVVGVDSDRASAEQMLKGGNDFVYTELNGVGHGCPTEVLEEMAALFEKKRLAVGKGKFYKRTDEIRSSFLEKPTKEEKHYLGDPEPPDPNAKAETPEAKRKRLLADVDLGGGSAEEAAAAYAEWKDAESVKPLCARLGSVARAADDVRAAAAKALGNIGSAEALPALERALEDESDVVFHATLGALAAIGDRKAGPALLKSLDVQAKRFEGKLMGPLMDFSDFDPRTLALGAASLAAAALADPKDAVARIRERVVKTVFEGNYRVDFLERAGEHPLEIRARLAKQVADALAKTGHPSAREAIARLREVGRKEPGIVSACDAALAAMDTPTAAPESAPPAEPGKE